MGNLFSEEVDKTDPRWYLSQESSKRISHQLAKTIATVHTHYKKGLGGDKEKAYSCLLRDFDKLLIETEPTLKGNRLFETRKIMLYRSLTRDSAEVKDFIVKATPDKIQAAAEIQLDIDFLKIITLWFENDEDMSGTLDLDEMSKLIRKLGLDLADEDLKKRMITYQKDDSTRNVKLDFNGFLDMYLDMTTVRAVADIFKASKTTPTDLLDVADLVRFLKATQKIQFERSDSYRIVEALFRDVKRDKGFEGITYRQFQTYLLDYQTNGWFDASYRYVWQDMRQPLTHYFINSSHNTYCAAGQLSGDSDPTMYSKVLRDGCRCVEIDCWPGGDDPRGPKVTHGGTIMTACWFRDVCLAINEAAFETSVYPVILSLELHIEDHEQTLMVEIMRDVFGDQLLGAREMEAMEYGGRDFSPVGLIRKILVKCKKETADDSDDSDDDPSAKVAEAGKGGGAKGDLHHAKKAAANNRLAAVSTVQAKAIPKSVRGNIKMALNLLRSYRHFNIVSISEQTFPKWSKFQSPTVAVTQKTLIRTYPKGTRIDSSNYSPTEGWALGAQCVALNLQTKDANYYVNRALFKTNGDSGYVLKPAWMRQEPTLATIGDDGRIGMVDSHTISQQQGHYDMRPQMKVFPIVEMIPEPAEIKIFIICAQSIPTPPNSDTVSPYISLQVISGDGSRDGPRRFRTQPVRNNGFDPHWLESFKFEVNSLSMSYLHISVSTKLGGLTGGEAILGENAINLSALRPGYRSIPFFNAQKDTRMRKIPVLLCHFEIRKHGSIDMHDI